MSDLPTTPGSLILAPEPKFYPAELIRNMGEVWQLQDDGLWQELTDNGKRGARMASGYFNDGSTVLYTAPEDPKPYAELHRATEELQTAELRLRGRQQEVDTMRRHVENLRQACEEDS